MTIDEALYKLMLHPEIVGVDEGDSGAIWSIFRLVAPYSVIFIFTCKKGSIAYNIFFEIFAAL